MFHYEFPIISNFSDIKHLVNDNFKVTQKDDFFTVKYILPNKSTFPTSENSKDFNVFREFRGLKFYLSNGNILSRPYHKFFNFGERDDVADYSIFEYPHTYMEKIDGSMIAVNWNKERESLMFTTKAGETDIANLAKNYFNSNPHYWNFCKTKQLNDVTILFEYVSKFNRIVIKYNEENLYLTGIRNNVDGSYHDIRQLASECSKYNIKCNFHYFNNTHIKDIIDLTKNMTGEEGLIIRFDNGHNVKIKTDEYIQLHKFINYHQSENLILQAFITDKLDDVISNYNEKSKEYLLTIQKQFFLDISKTVSNLTDMIFFYTLKHGFDAKKFALESMKIANNKFDGFSALFFEFQKLTVSNNDLDTNIQNFTNKWVIKNITKYIEHDIDRCRKFFNGQIYDFSDLELA